MMIQRFYNGLKNRHTGEPLSAKTVHDIHGTLHRALNKAVGGVPASQHMRGEAADITGGSPEANRELYSLMRRLNLPVDQAINEHDFTWIHVSYGPRHRRHYFAIR